jgi:hypothetical protein
MPRFVIDETKVIQAEWWDEGETVTIKKFTYGDRQKLASDAVYVGLVDGDGKKQTLAEAKIDTMNLGILEVGIVSWTFINPKTGREMPLLRRWIEALNPEDAEFILREINAFNPQINKRTEEEQDSFRGDGGDSMPGGNSSAAGVE